MVNGNNDREQGEKDVRSPAKYSIARDAAADEDEDDDDDDDAAKVESDEVARFDAVD